MAATAKQRKIKGRLKVARRPVDVHRASRRAAGHSSARKIDSSVLSAPRTEKVSAEFASFVTSVIDRVPVSPSQDTARKAAVIKKSMAGIGQGMSRGAERVADIILDEEKKLQGGKTKKITDETITMFKDVTRQLKSDLKGVKARDFVAVAAFNAGKASAAAKRAFQMLLG